MKIAIFSRDSNPDVDRPLFYASRDRFNMLVTTGAIKSLSPRTAQYTCEMRDPKKLTERAKPEYSDGGDNGRSWRIVHQTVPGFGPGAPEYQFIPIGGMKAQPRYAEPSNARRGVAQFMRANYNAV